MARNRDFKKNPSTQFRDVEDLGKQEAKDEIDALREGIEFHDHKYYVENDPVISDSVYDRLFHRLQELEEAFPEYRSENSPTRRVGAEPLDELNRVEHTAPLLSLHAALEQEEFDEFHESVRRQQKSDTVHYVLEPKFDGVSVEIIYEKGHFKEGSTRGDGHHGEDISANLRTIGSVPLTLQTPDRCPSFLAVRGEVFLPREGFQAMNRERVERGDKPYANPRNATGGILRRLESTSVARYPLDVFFYDVLKVEGHEFDTHWGELGQLREWGLKIDPHVARASSRKDVAAYHDRLGEERDDLPYEIDGIVIKVDDKALWEQLGTRHRSPRWALAWKFASREEITTLEDVVVQVGRTGKLTPVALLQPVDVGGVTVSRATLHNEGEARRKDVRPGDRVRIARAGDVIPEVIERVPQPGKQRAEAFRMPRKCPVCGTEIVREGAYHVCPNGLRCQPQLIGRIFHYGSRSAMDIEGLGEETARDLVAEGLVTDLADLYALSVDDLLNLEGIAEKTARNLHQAIQETKKPRLDRFLYALGIRHVGERVATMLAREFQSLDRLRKASLGDLKKMPDIGPEIAQSVHTFFQEEENVKILQRMQRLGVSVQDMPDAPERQPLQGKRFVFTGGLENYTRSEAEQAVERLGGRATSRVSGETDYVVAGEDPGSKLDDAKTEGVEILDERQFQELLSG
ncbi:NAD-dependent DNA ligase LigA [Thioalkalivibrio sp.]|uniref:NAD-dependent DNA ligase LigA n=1 Tax=Thioalkalivibrio sp. TaxID=2093813 RepID=UPI003567E201